jgi:glyoxylase-like metal-dependent hydrolase (beta-lactamase superfamily II)
LFKKNSMEVFPVIVPTSSKLKSFNFYLIRQGNSLTLIDTGLNTDDCWNSLQKTLRDHDFSLSDITEILLTHHHTDHIGLVDRMVSTHSIPVYAHPYAKLVLKRDTKYIKMREVFFRQLYREMGCGEMGENQVACLHNPIILSEDKKILSNIHKITNGQLLGFEILNIPGHAPDQIAFYHKENKWLFAGDILMEHMPCNAFIEPNIDGTRTRSLVQQKQSLEKFLSLDVELVFSGHGEVIENPEDLIKERLKEIDEKANSYINLINSGITIPSEMAQFRFEEKFERQFFNVMSEVIGYLDYLEFQGAIRKEKLKGIWHYF